MIFKYFETGPLMVNCYIIGDKKSREAVVIDPGGDVPVILEELDEDKLKCKMIINTHCHFDHTGGNRGLKEKTGAPIYIHPLEKDLLVGMSEMAKYFGVESERSPCADGFLNEGDIVKVGSEIEMEVLHTPGHSPGSISLYVKGKNMVIVGDVLFQYSIGRTDFPGASHRQLINSIKTKLYPLGDNVEVYPGHGPPTTIRQEKRYNPFLQEGVEMD
jgi:glyoxylase-like metal-dependent hydrolase (beta-lactamase superfamily II)